MTYHRANTSNFQHVKYTFVYMSNTIGVIALVESQYTNAKFKNSSHISKSEFKN